VYQAKELGIQEINKRASYYHQSLLESLAMEKSEGVELKKSTDIKFFARSQFFQASTIQKRFASHLSKILGKMSCLATHICLQSLEKFDFKAYVLFIS